MKQHYLPKCYLNEFVNNDGKLFVLDYKQFQQGVPVYPRLKTPTQICYEKDLYTMDTNFRSQLLPRGLNKYFIEQDIFWRYETYYPSIIYKVKNDRFLTHEDARFLLKFLVSLKLRNKFILNYFTREDHNNLIDDIIKDLRNELLSGAFPQYSNISLDEKEKALLHVQASVTNNQQFEKGAQLTGLIQRELSDSGVINEVVDKLIFYSWMIVRPTTSKFITTDNPGFCFDRSNGVNNTRFIEGSFVFPLTPRHCLLISDDKPDIAFMDDSRFKLLDTPKFGDTHLSEFVSNTNKLSLLNVNQLIISQSKEEINLRMG